MPKTSQSCGSQVKYSNRKSPGISRWEIKHSNILAWLLSPSENHNLGTDFLNGIIEKILSGNPYIEYDALDLLLLNTSSCYVQREWKDIDILISSPSESLVIAIENKVGSTEHSNQLKKYLDIIERDYSEYKYKLYVYLTPNGDDPSDPVHWKVLRYEDIAELLEEILTTHESMNNDVRTLLKHYLLNIRRNVVRDRELERVCNEIYKKHRAAFDLVYQYKTIGRSRLTDVINEVLEEYARDGKLIMDPEWSLGFHTSVMNTKLPPLEEPISSWKNTHLYQYWFNIYDDGEYSSFYLIFELGGNNVPESQKEMMHKLIAKHRPNYSKAEFKYNRIYRTKKTTIKNDEDNYEDLVIKAAKSAIDAILIIRKLQ